LIKEPFGRVTAACEEGISIKGEEINGFKKGGIG